MKIKIKRPMSLMTYKQKQNHKIVTRLSLLMVFCLSFLSVYIFKSLLDGDTPATTGYMAAAGAIIVGLSVAFAADRNAFSSSIESFDHRAAESIQSATYLYVVLNDLIERLKIVREQAKNGILRSDLSDYILNGYNYIFEINLYKTIQGEKIGSICALAESIHGLCELINTSVDTGKFNQIPQDRTILIVNICDGLGEKLALLKEDVKNFRFGLDLGND